MLHLNPHVMRFNEVSTANARTFDRAAIAATG